MDEITGIEVPNATIPAINIITKIINEKKLSRDNNFSDIGTEGISRQRHATTPKPIIANIAKKLVITHFKPSSTNECTENDDNTPLRVKKVE